jgi:phenylalanyl-tRNA synthetase beta chain
MKVSLNIVKHYNQKYGSASDPYAYGIENVVKRIGAQLGAVEDVIDYRDKYKDVLLVRVVSCEKHPNADKLHLCLVDDGRVAIDVDRNPEGLVQVVCGASNVRAGMLALWLPPGATVPNSHSKDPFVLDARELRGKISNGMLASPKELDISDEHEGILEVLPEEFDREIHPGETGASLYNLDDVVIDCENKMFTHRPDCFGIMGVAREIAGIFGDKYTSPDWYVNPLKHEITADLQILSTNEITEKVPRFMLQSVADLTVKNSPIWLQAYLQRVGSKSINNIVDYTNYFMTLTGQPLHAYDYDKVKALSKDSAMLFPRMAKSGETLELLNGKKVDLHPDDIVIATDQKVVGLAGVMGGAETEVDSTTKNIILECANFDMYTIRRTSMRHGLFTDAVTRFNKGQSPLQNDRVIARIVQEIVLYADGKVAGAPIDLHGFDTEADNLSHVVITTQFINERLGTQLTAEQIKDYLENVEFVVENDDSVLYVTAPFWRMDISIGEDIVEEVGRMHGYQNIPIVLPQRSSKPAPKNLIREFKQNLRHTLVTAGASEVLTYSFVHGKLLTASGIDPEAWAIRLRNALSPDLQYYRPSLVPSLLHKVHKNLKASAGDDKNEFALFEIGKAHVKGHHEESPEDTLPKQMSRLSFVVAADAKTAKSYKGSAYYHAKKYIDEITNGQAVYQELDTNDYPITAPYQKERSAVVMMGHEQDEPIGVIGEFNQKAKKAFKLPDYCAGFEIDIDLLFSHVSPKKYEKLSEYPSVNQDITFEVTEKMAWESLYEYLHAEFAVAKAEIGYNFNLLPKGIYQEDDSDKKRISFAIELNHHQKTLTSEEASNLIEHISESIKYKLHAVRI